MTARPPRPGRARHPCHVRRTRMHGRNVLLSADVVGKFDRRFLVTEMSPYEVKG